MSPVYTLRQKKVTKEKATPTSRSLRDCPAMLAVFGGCATRSRNLAVALTQTVLADFPSEPCASRRAHGDPESPRALNVGAWLYQ